MTDDDLKQLLTRLDAAHAASTQGEWWLSPRESSVGHACEECGYYEPAPDICAPMEPHHLPGGGVSLHIAGMSWADRGERDGAFCVESHNAYPQLAAALRRLLEERDQSRDESQLEHNRAEWCRQEVEGMERGFHPRVALAEAERDQARAEVERLRAAVAAEREACAAKIEEQSQMLTAMFGDTRHEPLCRDLARAIRARRTP